MSPSDHLPSRPPVAPASAAGSRTFRAGRTGGIAPALAALAGGALLLSGSLAPVREIAPWVLSLAAACTGAAGGLALLLAWAAYRRSGRPEAPLPAPAAVPGMAPGMVPCEAGTGVADAARIAELRAAARQAARSMRDQQIAAMDARAELAGAIVHDMNNTLGAVAGYADFLTADLPAGSPQADYAGRILAAVDRGRKGLRRLAMASRAEPAQLRTEPVVRVLNEAAALLRAAPSVPSGFTVLSRPDAPNPRCDAMLLTRTLAGLAEELIEAAGRGADLRLCLSVAPSGAQAVDGSAPGGNAHEREVDGGDGKGGDGEDGSGDGDAVRAGWRVRTLLTPQAGLHTLFELRIDGRPLADDVLFAIVDPLLSTRARNRRGNEGHDEADAPPAALLTARRHDGGLSLLTHPGEGTAVRLRIPAVPPAQPRPAPVPPKHPVAPVVQVLVIEADPATGDRMQTGLEQQGCEVSVCDDPRDALDVVADEPGFFDVVVIGPGLSTLTAGAALVVRLKSLRPDLPCVTFAAAAAAGSGGPADLELPLPLDLPRLGRGVAALAAGRGEQR
ncbi:hypothetical protein ABMY26_33075 [Azospirillum sp. HJ39]|uniref:hypothetical protein n=1 Tax=Azospirillum sp. HJ39 TaxID=3159496 RepID=UPI00355926EE